MSLDIKKETHCSRCNSNLAMLSRNGDCHGIYRDNVCVEVICPVCNADARSQKWIENREFTTFLVMEAVSAVMYVDEFKDTSQLQPIYALIKEKHIDVYREIVREYREIEEAASMAEIAVWYGRPDRANMETIKASRKFSKQYPAHYLLKKDGKPVPSFDLTLGEKAVKAYYEKSPSAAHSYYHDDFKVLMLGTGGRLLTTISDVRSKNDPKSKFCGAYITLIFDESSDYPRGGIQGQVGTKQELLGLIEAYRSPDLKFKADKKVSIF